MQMFCNALIVELPDGRIVLSALVMNRNDLTQDQIRMLNKVGIDKNMKHNTQYNLSTPNDKVHIIVMED
jgi:ATP phosphoribosyltransferase